MDFLGYVTKDPKILCLLSFAVVPFDGSVHITHAYPSAVPTWVSVF